MKIVHLKKILTLILPLALAGCSSSTPIQDILDGRKVDYEQGEYQKRKDLLYPPDIIIDAAQAESQLLSEYRLDDVPATINDEEDEVLLDDERKVSYRRDGNLRWIDVDLSAGETYARVLRFWGSLELPLHQENARLGTIETDWLDLRQTVPSVGLSAVIDNLLRRVSDSGARDKFVTRIEGGSDKSSVFIAHRHIAASFDKEGLFSGYQPLPADAEVEAEMLRRMMIYFAGESQADLVEEEIIAVEEEATSDYQLEEEQLRINKPLEEAWLLVRIGLDRGGFTINDRDFGERAYYIRHSGGPESNKIFGQAETGFFNKLFGEQKPILRDIKMILSADGDDTLVRVVADDDDELTALQQSVLLELLSINLP